jgi:hypothetical protein
MLLYLIPIPILLPIHFELKQIYKLVFKTK